MTNRKKILSKLSNEDLAAMLMHFCVIGTGCDNCLIKDGCKSEEGIAHWLGQEAE